MHVFVNGRKLALDPKRAIGKGGEADVYDVGLGVALKVFKPPEHPDLAGDAEQQQAARRRIDEHQRKLPAFPRGLPERVVAPLDLARDKAGRIVGYSMPLLAGAEVLYRYGDRGFRQAGIGGDTIAALFRDLHATVGAVHRAAVVIGDFNDCNVLVAGAAAHLIDADSFQFGSFLCPVFTERFVDPRLCDPAAPRPILVRPHDADSDWYAFVAMLLRCLLYVDPYGGVLKPGELSRRVPAAARPLHRISVFHPEVRYPKPAQRWDVLPDDLLQHFHAVFVKDLRGCFPLPLLDELRFTRCTACGLEHARRLCPACSGAPPAAVREVVRVRGEVRSTRVFVTRGTILVAALMGGLRLLVHEDGQLKREDGSVVLAGSPDPRMRFALHGAATLVAREASLVVLRPDRQPERVAVDVVGTEPSFASNGERLFWVRDGILQRDSDLGPERIGDVLAGQTRIWAGPRFGFGLYRAGDLQVFFVFDGRGRGINDGVRLQALRGLLVDAACTFAQDRCYFFATLREGGRTFQRCAVVRPDGAVEAVEEAEVGDGTWLGQIHGTCAAGGMLLAATDDGIVRVEPDGGRLVKTREFPDTEPFVDAGCRLLAGPDGLYVVDRQEVRRLELR